MGKFLKTNISLLCDAAMVISLVLSSNIQYPGA